MRRGAGSLNSDGRQHAKVILAEQIYAGRALWRARFAPPQPKLLPKHHEVHLYLDAGEEIANALSRSRAEWAQCEFMPVQTIFGAQPIRIKSLRRFPKLGAMLNEVRRYKYLCSCRNEVFAYHVITERLARH